MNGKAVSYSDALRLFNQAIDELTSISTSPPEDPLELTNLLMRALSDVLKALLILTGRGYYPYADITNLAALLLESGVINKELFSEVVNAYLGLRGIIKIDRDYTIRVIRKLIRVASERDPYLNQQLTLFRY